MPRSSEKRLRFSVEQDVMLLKEVIDINPFEDIDRWKDVHENFVNECNVPFSLRTCKDHCNHLLNLYLKDSLKVRPKETPEDFAIKQKYLEQIIEIRKQYNPVSIPRRGPRRSNWDDTDDSPNVKSEPTDMKSEDSDDDFFWEEENERDKKETEKVVAVVDIEAKLKQQELAIEERKLTLKEKRQKLEEEKFELNKLERTRRMEIERAERDMYRKGVMQNQLVINALLERYNKRNGGNLCIL